MHYYAIVITLLLRHYYVIAFSVDRDFDWDKLNLNQIDGNSNRFKPPNSALYKVTVTMTGLASNGYQIRDRKNFSEISENFCSLWENILQRLGNPMLKASSFQNPVFTKGFLRLWRIFTRREQNRIQKFRKKKIYDNLLRYFEVTT